MASDQFDYIKGLLAAILNILLFKSVIEMSL